MIKLSNLVKSHPVGDNRRHKVFDGINLQIPSKKNIAILGVNGAGKSTLLRMIGGIDLPDRGKIEINGTVSPPLGLQSGVHHQLSGLDNAKFACRIQGDKGQQLQRRLQQIEEFAELGKFFREPVGSYSSGMRARLAFACSVSFNYDYLLVDELTSVGDQAFRDKAARTFSEMRGKSTLVLVSHNLSLIKEHCDCGIYVNDGQVKLFHHIENAVAQYRKDCIARAKQRQAAAALGTSA